MDLEEWELLPDDGFLEIHDDGGKKIFSRKYGDPKNMFNMNYFISPSPNSPKFVESTELATSTEMELPTLDKATNDHEVVKEVIMKSATSERIKTPDLEPFQADHDQISQVFFKKMKENEFVDMKMDSPKSNHKGIWPQFENRGNPIKDEALEGKNSFPKVENENEKEIMGIKKNNMDGDLEDEINWEENSGGLNIWKWSLSGIGAICSFGVAAATICIIILGGRQKNKQNHHQNQKVQFHIYTEDKRIKQVVQQATRLNEAISAVRGVPVARAHVTFGGYYDGLWSN